MTLSDPQGGVLTLTNPRGWQFFLKTGQPFTFLHSPANKILWPTGPM